MSMKDNCYCGSGGCFHGTRTMIGPQTCFLVLFAVVATAVLSHCSAMVLIQPPCIRYRSSVSSSTCMSRSGCSGLFRTGSTSSTNSASSLSLSVLGGEEGDDESSRIASLTSESVTSTSTSTSSESSISCPHFVVEPLGDTTPHEYFQFLQSRRNSNNPDDVFEDEHQPMYRDISKLCLQVFFGKGKNLDDTTPLGPDVSYLEKSFQPHEIRRRRENRRLDNEMFVAYELRLATEEDRTEYNKLKEKIEKLEYREMQNHNNNHIHSQQPYKQQQYQDRYGGHIRPTYPPSYNAAQPENPYPRHSYDWEKEEYARRHSRQYEEQKELQKAFIQQELNGGSTGGVEEYTFDPIQEEMRQSQQNRAWNQKSDRRPGRNGVPFQNDNTDEFHQYRGSTYEQNPYLHEEPLVMGGNLGGTTARAGRNPPSPENFRRPRPRRRPGTSFPTRGVGSTGPLFAHDPFLSSIFGYDGVYRSHARQDEQSHGDRNVKGAPSNNRVWGVDESYSEIDSLQQDGDFSEGYSTYYDHTMRSQQRHRQSQTGPPSSHPERSDEERLHQTERELFRDAVQSSREQGKHAQEMSQRQHFYEEGDILYVRGSLVGFVEVSNIPYNLGRVEDLEYAKAGMRSPKRAVVSNLVVDQRARKSGIGSRLLEACELHARNQWNAKELILEVEEEEEVDDIESNEGTVETNVKVTEFLNKRGFTILFAEPASQRYDAETGEVLEQIQRRKDVMSKRIAGKNRLSVDNDSPNDILSNEQDDLGAAGVTHRDSQSHSGNDVVDVEYFESIEP